MVGVGVLQVCVLAQIVTVGCCFHSCPHSSVIWLGGTGYLLVNELEGATKGLS